MVKNIVSFLFIACFCLTIDAYAQSDDQIVFTSDRDGNREIYVMNADGSGVQRLTSNSWEDREPAWSSDRSQIALFPIGTTVGVSM